MSSQVGQCLSETGLVNGIALGEGSPQDKPFSSRVQPFLVVA